MSLSRVSALDIFVPRSPLRETLSDSPSMLRNLEPIIASRFSAIDKQEDG